MGHYLSEMDDGYRPNKVRKRIFSKPKVVKEEAFQLTKESWDKAIENMMNYGARQANYKQRVNNMQHAMSLPQTYASQMAAAGNGNNVPYHISTPPEVAISMGDFPVFLVSEIDSGGNAYPKAVFTKEAEADKYIELHEEWYLEKDVFTLDLEVPKNDVDKTE